MVDDLSLWEFSASVSGWAKANGGDSKPPPPTEEEHDALIEKYRDV